MPLFFKMRDSVERENIWVIQLSPNDSLRAKGLFFSFEWLITDQTSSRHLAHLKKLDFVGPLKNLQDFNANFLAF